MLFGGNGVLILFFSSVGLTASIFYRRQTGQIHQVHLHRQRTAIPTTPTNTPYSYILPSIRPPLSNSLTTKPKPTIKTYGTHAPYVPASHIHTSPLRLGATPSRTTTCTRTYPPYLHRWVISPRARTPTSSRRPKASRKTRSRSHPKPSIPDFPRRSRTLHPHLHPHRTPPRPLPIPMPTPHHDGADKPVHSLDASSPYSPPSPHPLSLRFSPCFVC